MNKTQNYQLNQWERTDKVQMEDFNADNAKIDAALTAKADKTALAALAQTVNTKGNCRIEFGSYQGNGSDSRVMTITTSVRPMLVMILDGNCNVLVRGENEAFVCYNGSLTSAILVTWGENGISWQPKYSSYKAPAFLNENRSYHYVVLG